MAAILTVAQLREHVETDLTDDAVQRLIDSEDGELVYRFGPVSTATEILRGGDPYVFLTRQATSITSVTEERNGAATLLAADDYEMWWAQMLKREFDGTHPGWPWGEEVTVVYTPQDSTAQRKLLLIQLVQLAVRYNGVQQEAIGGGDHSETQHDYQRERERLLRRLAPRGGVFLA